MEKNVKLEQYYARCDMSQIKGHLKEFLEKAKEEIPQITAEEIDLEKMVLIDVREADEFASGVIPAKTIFTIPRGKLEFAIDDKLVDLSDRPIVCYCLKGARGILGAKTLKDLGFNNVSNLEGGIESWVASGRMIKNYIGYFKMEGN
ncbi:MAG: rhodanese-like domain-containing protein [Campylobacterales bacterium]|jgi:rhodanese-related sulfurtransferase|nr:rhodanese-like domain-containing protein [Campylobacterales bacterium]HEO99537.1 rhodanese-like domain-containing protein [Campylobacterota bacterium]